MSKKAHSSNGGMSWIYVLGIVAFCIVILSALAKNSYVSVFISGIKRSALELVAALVITVVFIVVVIWFMGGFENSRDGGAL